MPWSWTGDETRWSQDQKRASLRNDFRDRIDKVLAVLRQRGWRPKIHYGWRSIETQKALKAAGRSTVDFSFHNNIDDQGQPAALAADIVDERYGWGGDDPNSPLYRSAMAFFAALGAAGKAWGLSWGGDWITFKDYAHLQFYGNDTLGSIQESAMSVWRRITGAVSSATGSGTPPAGGMTSAASTVTSTVQGWFQGSGGTSAAPATMAVAPAVSASQAQAAANAAALAAANRARGQSTALVVQQQPPPQPGGWVTPFMQPFQPPAQAGFVQTQQSAGVRVPVPTWAIVGGGVAVLATFAVLVGLASRRRR